MTEREKPYHVLVAIGEPRQMTILMSLAVPLARSRKGLVTPLYVGPEVELPPWLIIPPEDQDVVEHPQMIQSPDVSGAILDYARDHAPDLLLLHWRGETSRGRYLLGRTLDPVIQYAPCDVAVVRSTEDPEAFEERMEHLKRVLVPSSGGPNATLAMSLALDLGPDVQVTALRIAHRNLGAAAISAQWEILTSAMEDVADDPRIEPHVAIASGVAVGIREEAEKDYDLAFIGATRESLVDRLLFGNLPQQIASTLPIPVIIIRRRDPLAVSVLRRARWRLVRALPQLTLNERISIYRQVRRGARVDADFYTMMTLATGIGALGLLLNSPAVIIGAMIIAPFMAALMGVALGVVQGDAWLLRLALRTTLLGILVVLGVSALVGALVPGDQVTPEMLSRSTPALLDLAVALISGAAAAYATSRRDVASALPGVAIAVALVPPLAGVGLAAVARDRGVALGAALLFSTNLVAIVAAASLIFLWMGFRPNQGEKERARVFRSGVLSTAVLLAGLTVILGVLSARSIGDTVRDNKIQRVLEHRTTEMGAEVELASWEIVGDSASGLELEVWLQSPHSLDRDELVAIQAILMQRLQRPVSMAVTVLPITRIGPDMPEPAPTVVLGSSSR